MAQPQACAALGEASRAVAGAVVGHQASDPQAKLAELGDGGLVEGDDTGAGFVGIHLNDVDARAVVDAHAHVLPAGPGACLMFR